MRTFSTISLIDSLESMVEAHLNTAIVCFQNLPEEVLLQPAPDGGWSIAQNLEHLNTYGHYYLPHMKKAVETGSVPASGVFKSSWLGNYFTKMMHPDSGKKKYKAFKNHIPAPDLDAHKVVAEFIQQQEDLLDCLRKSRNINLNSAKIPVSISKWIKLNLGDTFRFFIAHNERHMRKAGRQKSENGCRESGVGRQESGIIESSNTVNRMLISAEDLMLRSPYLSIGNNQKLNRLLGL